MYPLLQDIHKLDMKTLQWTAMEDSASLCHQTLSTVSNREIMSIGGLLNGSISNQVRLFDVEKYKMKDEVPLPQEEFGGSEGGLMAHRAVEFPRDNGLSIILVGGYINKDLTKHPDHMIMFDVTY